MNLVTELTRYFFKRKKIWLLPPLIVGLLVGGLLVLTEGSAFTPLIYALF
tara:strand:+ start:566 stop:715 length:150 start_codon:yes stop_codon:yes gene_type:complete